MLIALTLQSELWTKKYTLNNEIISFPVFKGSHPINFSAIKFSMWEFMWLKCRDYPSLRASDQPMMKPRSLYGSRQEEMKATNRPTYSFWVNSGWTHMNKLHRNQAHLNSHQSTLVMCLRVEELTSVFSPGCLPASQTDSMKGKFKASVIQICSATGTNGQ